MKPLTAQEVYDFFKSLKKDGQDLSKITINFRQSPDHEPVECTYIGEDLYDAETNSVLESVELLVDASEYEEIEVKHIQTRMNARNDAFWYNGQVALVSKGSRQVSVEANGHVRVLVPGEIEFLENDAARKAAIDRGYTDRKLKSFEWDNNNWFNLYLDNGNGNFTLVDNAIFYSYDDAIKEAKEIV